MVFSFLPYGLDFSLDGPGETSSCQQPQKKGAYHSFGWVVGAVSYQRAVALHYTYARL